MPKATFDESYDRIQTWAEEESTMNEGPQGSTLVALKLKDLSSTRRRNWRVVLTCLKCLDDDNEDFNGSIDNTSADFVAVYFIETVMKLPDGMFI
jgi:hypothetical protein